MLRSGHLGRRRGQRRRRGRRLRCDSAVGASGQPSALALPGPPEYVSGWLGVAANLGELECAARARRGEPRHCEPCLPLLACVASSSSSKRQPAARWAAKTSCTASSAAQWFAGSGSRGCLASWGNSHSCATRTAQWGVSCTALILRHSAAFTGPGRASGLQALPVLSSELAPWFGQTLLLGYSWAELAAQPEQSKSA